MEKYEVLEIEVIFFDDEDVIMASGTSTESKRMGIKYEDEEGE